MAGLAASGMHAGDFYTAQILADNAARAAGGSPVLDEHQRAYAERIVGPNPRSPEDRERARAVLQDSNLAREEAARRRKAFIADPANVDALIALVMPAAVPPSPDQAPWLRKP